VHIIRLGGISGVGYVHITHHKVHIICNCVSYPRKNLLFTEKLHNKYNACYRDTFHEIRQIC